MQCSNCELHLALVRTVVVRYQHTPDGSFYVGSLCKYWITDSFVTLYVVEECNDVD